MALMHRFPPNRGSLSRFFSALMLIVIFSVAFFVGAFLFLVILGLVAISAVALYLRLRWSRRRWTRETPSGPATLDGEFTVENRREDRR